MHYVVRTVVSVVLYVMVTCVSVLVHVVDSVPVVILLSSLLSVDNCEDLAAGLLHCATLGFLHFSSLDSSN